MRAVLRLLLPGLVLLCGAAAPSAAPVASNRNKPMLNGDWQIAPSDMPGPDHDETGFLPAGTRLRLTLLGPTRQAIEEQRRDQLGVRIELLPPFPATICAAGTMLDFCRDGRPIAPDRSVTIEATVSLSTWKSADAEAADNELFVENGARIGSRFALIVADKAEWMLWLQTPDTMLGQYLSNRLQAVSQHWIRIKRGGVQQ